MPEGPEIFLASRLINTVSLKRLYGGRVVKSEVSTKNPDVEWEEEVYRVRAQARGKELMVTLCGGEVEKKGEKTLDIIFRFGMSGSFKFTPVQEIPKHAHLRFYTINEDIPMVLSFVDYRRFGRWEVGGTWGRDRGPDPMWEYPSFRENILAGLKSADFNKPICEAMLNQKYFNGIGNYLRAEILYRCGIRPFDEAREVLSELKPFSKWYEMQSKIKVKKMCEVKPDVLDLCHILPKEVINLSGGGKGYNVDLDADEDEYKEFREWLQCYYQDGMKNMVDHNRRTMWFSGEPGRLTPKDACSRSMVKRKKSQTRKQNKNIDEEQISEFDENGKESKQTKLLKEETKQTKKRRHKKQSEKDAEDELDTECTATEGLQNKKNKTKYHQPKATSAKTKSKTGVKVTAKIASRATATSVTSRAPTRRSSRLRSQ